MIRTGRILKIYDKTYNLIWDVQRSQENFQSKRFPETGTEPTAFSLVVPLLIRNFKGFPKQLHQSFIRKQVELLPPSLFDPYSKSW